MSARHPILNKDEGPSIDPISVRIPVAVRMTGLSKSKIYQLIATGDIEAAKVGRATVVFVESLRSFLRSRSRKPNSRL
jgi:excisionase family DNA binding protein